MSSAARQRPPGEVPGVAPCTTSGALTTEGRPSSSTRRGHGPEARLSPGRAGSGTRSACPVCGSSWATCPSTQSHPSRAIHPPIACDTTPGRYELVRRGLQCHGAPYPDRVAEPGGRTYDGGIACRRSCPVTAARLLRRRRQGRRDRREGARPLRCPSTYASRSSTTGVVETLEERGRFRRRVGRGSRGAPGGLLGARCLPDGPCRGIAPRSAHHRRHLPTRNEGPQRGQRSRRTTSTSC